MRDIMTKAAIETMPVDRRPILIDADVPQERRVYLCAPPRAAADLNEALVRARVPHTVDRDPASPLRGVKYTTQAFTRMLSPEAAAFSAPTMVDEAMARNRELRLEGVMVAEAARIIVGAVRSGKPLAVDLPDVDALGTDRIATMSHVKEPVTPVEPVVDQTRTAVHRAGVGSREAR